MATELAPNHSSGPTADSRIGPIQALDLISMIEALRSACYDAGRLTGVREALLVEESSLVSAVELVFEQLTITVAAEPDYDKVAVSVSSLSSDEAISTSPQAFWAMCIGKRVKWAWLLTNHQGYSDGLRLEFKNTDEKEAVVVELIAMASSFELSVMPKA